MADVHLPRSLAALFPGTPRRLTARGATVAEVIDDLDAQVPGIRNRIVDAGPEIRAHINVFVAGQRATLATPVPPDAVLHVVPAVSGGEDRFVSSPPAEGQPTVDREAHGGRGDGPLDQRALQILSTEHWSLLSARSLVYNESFARGGMFLALLSATLVALGLISTATGFSDAFLSVAAVLLGLDLFVGFATLGRIAAAGNEDIRYLQGMNRIRHAYFEIAPGVEPYFVTTGYDDVDSVLAFYGPADPSALRGIVHGLTTMPGMISVICVGIAGVLAAVLLLLLTHDGGLASVGGLAAFLVMFVVLVAVQMRIAGRMTSSLEARFPRPAPDDPPTR